VEVSSMGKKKKALWIAIAVLPLLVASAAGTFAIWRTSMRNAIEAHVAALREAGEPTEPEDILGPPVPDEENAADIFLKASRWYEAHLADEPETDMWPEKREDWTKENWREMAAWVETCRPFLDLIRKGVARPHVRLSDRWPPWIKAADENMAVLQVLTNAAKVLMPAALLHLDDPDGTERATRSLILLLDVADHAPGGDTIFQILRMAVYHCAAETLEKLARKPGFDAAQARVLLRDRLGVVEDREPLRHALRGERVAWIWMLRHLDEPLSHSRPWHSAGHGPWIESAFVWRDALPCLDRMAGLLKALDLPDHELMAALTATPPREPAWLDNRSVMILASDKHPTVIASRRLRTVALTRLARIGLALLEHRQETDTWPKSLDELAERMEKGVPLDPYTGTPFLYERDGKTVRLISAGDEEPRLSWELKR
jgi:hypothetical protein